MLIPDNIDHFESTGEKILYLRFKNDGSTKKMYILHSLFTNHHIKNISGELDFLVLVPNQGVFAIEVKHGRVSRKEGTWSFENRNGKVTTKKISPFAQVNGTMNSIRNFILEKISHKKALHNRLSKVLWGTGVAFTGMLKPPNLGTEAHSWQVLTRREMNMPIGYYINALSKGSHNQNKGKFWYDVNLSKPTENDCKLLLKILRGDFDLDYSEINKIIDNELIIEEYTKEQFHLLDFVNYNSRCLIEGAAGTGKTLMAIEILRRQIENKTKAGLFCYNRQLGIKLSNTINRKFTKASNSCYCGTLHSFMLSRVNSSPPSNDDELQNYYNEELPIEFLILNENIEETEKFDVIILDEAQDLITPYYLEVLDLILKGGIKNGKLISFGDFSNQAIYLNKPDETIRNLAEKTNFTRFPPLKINCRNTRRIASHNTLLTGIDKPEFTSKSIEGDLIVTKFPVPNSQQTVIESIIQEILNKKIPVEKITLLSSKRFENSILCDSKYIKTLVNNGLETSTIQSFKGLENTIIILYDFDEISSEEAKKLLYVGISRARLSLFIVLKNSLKKSYEKLIANNFNA